ncbi:MAG: hypothetical protein KGJ23_05655 [Euryarchaeota archaeon]|nr:hypothetical protein [Euryarchaeota archaeon]MDE1836084.1 hypothetical protein [Euryarchaeota archaeon]MDE1879968.1 hypothetical protein [Euryarchaeota archaeon]MDE2044062.1 hypothetical protein [Thermoplasmata archaeon]
MSSAADPPSFGGPDDAPVVVPPLTHRGEQVRGLRVAGVVLLAVGVALAADAGYQLVNNAFAPSVVSTVLPPSEEVVFADTTSAVFAALLPVKATGQAWSNVSLYRSLDRGGHWSELPAHPTIPGSDSPYPWRWGDLSLAADGAQLLLAMATLQTSPVPLYQSTSIGAAPAHAPYRVEAWSSADEGQTWGLPRLLAQNASPFSSLSVAVQGSLEAVAFNYEGGPYFGTSYGMTSDNVTISADGGTTWSPSQNVTPSFARNCPYPPWASTSASVFASGSSIGLVALWNPGVESCYPVQSWYWAVPYSYDPGTNGAPGTFVPGQPVNLSGTPALLTSPEVGAYLSMWGAVYGLPGSAIQGPVALPDLPSSPQPSLNPTASAVGSEAGGGLTAIEVVPQGGGILRWVVPPGATTAGPPTRTPLRLGGSSPYGSSLSDLKGAIGGPTWVVFAAAVGGCSSACSSSSPPPATLLIAYPPPPLPWYLGTFFNEVALVLAAVSILTGTSFLVIARRRVSRPRAVGRRKPQRSTRGSRGENLRPDLARESIES